MNDRQLDDERDSDRLLRAQIDPLVGQLSPLGKFELATRLIGESMVDSVRARKRVQPVIPATVIRVIEPAKEEGEREEAPGRSGSPTAHGSGVSDAAPTTHDRRL